MIPDPRPFTASVIVQPDRIGARFDAEVAAAYRALLDAHPDLAFGRLERVNTKLAGEPGVRVRLRVLAWPAWA